MKAWLSAVLLLALAPAALRAQVPSDEPLRAAYETLYQGKANAAAEQFRAMLQREPENLAAAYGTLIALYTRLPEDASLEKEFEQRAEQLMQKAQARYDGNKRDREALLYLAQVYFLRGGYRFSRNKGMWGAARDAAKSKNFSEEYLKLDQQRADAYYALGMYNYYVALAPSFVKVFRILLFLPPGSRSEGLKQLERASREGKLWAPRASQELIGIYGWFENRPEDGVRVGEELQRHYPSNTDVQLRLANLYTHPAVEDHERAAQQYLAIAQSAASSNPGPAPGHRYRALLGLAGARAQQWRLDEAIAVLTQTINAAPASPDWVLPRFLLARGRYRILLNDPKAAEDARRILAEQKWKSGWHEGAGRQLKDIDERQKSGEAAVFAALIPGNRLVAERRWDEALKFYERLRQQYPNDWQVRYRLAYLDFARGQYDRAAEAFQQITNGAERMPNWVKAGALLHLGYISDLRNQREQAVKLYKRVTDEYEQESAAQAARYGLISPYRRRTASGS